MVQVNQGSQIERGPDFPHKTRMELKCLFMEFSRVFSLSSVFNRVVPNSVVVARLIAERILEVDAESPVPLTTIVPLSDKLNPTGRYDRCDTESALFIRNDVSIAPPIPNDASGV